MRKQILVEKITFTLAAILSAICIITLMLGIFVDRCYAWEADYAPEGAATATYQDGSQYVKCFIGTDYNGVASHMITIDNPTGGTVYIGEPEDEFWAKVASGEQYKALGGKNTAETIYFSMNGQFYQAYVSVDTQSEWSGAGLPTITFSEPTNRGDGTASVWMHLSAPNGMREVTIAGAATGINGAWMKEAPAFYFALNGQTTLDLEVVLSDANALRVELVDNLGNRETEECWEHSKIIPYYWLSDYFPANYFDYANIIPFRRQFVKEKDPGYETFPTITLDYFWNADGSAKVIDRTQIYGTDWSDANNYTLNPSISSQEILETPDGVLNYLSPAQLQAGQTNTPQPTVSMEVQTTAAPKVTQPETTTTQATTSMEQETTSAIPPTTTVPVETKTSEQETTPVQETTTIEQITTATEPETTVTETVSQPETSVLETTTQTTTLHEAVPETTAEVISGTTPESTTTPPETTTAQASATPEATESLAPVETKEAPNTLPLIIGAVIMIAIAGGAFLVLKKNKK